MSQLEHTTKTYFNLIHMDKIMFNRASKNAVTLLVLKSLATLRIIIVFLNPKIPVNMQLAACL